MSSSSQKRQTNLVDRTVQGALARRVLLHWVLFMGTCVLSVSLMQILLGDPNLAISTHLRAAGTRYLLFVIVLAALLPAFVLDTIRLSNRFAGPMFRIKTALRRTAAGEAFEPLKFRGKDFWVELADDYNRMMVKVEQQLAEAEGKLAAAELKLSRLEHSESQSVAQS